MAKQKVDATLDVEIVRYLDKLAKKTGMNRSQAINSILGAAIYEDAVQVKTTSRTMSVDGKKTMQNVERYLLHVED